MADPVFIATAVLTIGAAIVALESRELIYGGIALSHLDAGCSRILFALGFSFCSNVSDHSLCRGSRCTL